MEKHLVTATFGELEYLNKIIKHFRRSLRAGIPLEGDGDLAGMWMLGACYPEECASLLSAGIAELFSPDASLPDSDTFVMAEKMNTVRATKKRWGWTGGESNPRLYNANVLYYHYTIGPRLLSWSFYTRTKAIFW